ncbi:nucleotidyltransferase domain-containing protein [Nocardioides pinisoli]|uniref:Amino acid transporter n=1 Tax=Nocardioides pinisoli TaxID=2950279 RepID=A0ABT1KRV7_9ACTN|nr:hypothetical protein [Nocardioides pinisoli]MCP3420469.1 hypothetical protein [Nocardioides pinisoli]
MSDVEPLARTPEEQAEDEAFIRLYGAWEVLTPPEAAAMLRGHDRPWWIVGGWAIDAATGVPREHEDLDVSMLASDVPAFYEHLKSEWHLWNQVGGTLTPYSDERTEPLDRESQIWVRRDATSAWVLDVILIPDRGGLWVSKRDPEHTAPVDDVVWTHSDGIRYQRPEIVLLHKALKARPKDERDLRTTWPVLDDAARGWLAQAVARLYPDHQWLPLFESLGGARVRHRNGPAPGAP